MQSVHDYPPEQLDHLNSDMAFELRCERRHRARVKALSGRTWECRECSTVYGPEWVAHYGLECDADCNGALEEVRPRPAVVLPVSEPLPRPQVRFCDECGLIVDGPRGGYQPHECPVCCGDLMGVR